MTPDSSEPKSRNSPELVDRVVAQRIAALHASLSRALSPGGYHVMFAHLAKPLVKGEKVKATLSFERAGQVVVEFPVEGLGASGPAAPGGSMGGMKM